MTGGEAGAPLTIGILAPGVWRRRRRLRQLLGPDVSLVFGRTRGVDAVAGWGLKGSGRDRSREAGLPYLALEDSFLSRLGADEKRFGLIGIVADPVGIYYDAREPSLVEELIAASADRPEPEEITALLTAMRREGLGKVNTLDRARLMAPMPETGAYDIIVVDQIAGDYSIPGGLATDETFVSMLEAAHDENPGARIAVKLHPYDGVGERRGHLREAAERFGCVVLPHTANWMRCAASPRSSPEPR